MRKKGLFFYYYFLFHAFMGSFSVLSQERYVLPTLLPAEDGISGEVTAYSVLRPPLSPSCVSISQTLIIDTEATSLDPPKTHHFELNFYKDTPPSVAIGACSVNWIPESKYLAIYGFSHGTEIVEPQRMITRVLPKMAKSWVKSFIENDTNRWRDYEIKIFIPASFLPGRGGTSNTGKSYLKAPGNPKFTFYSPPRSPEDSLDQEVKKHHFSRKTTLPISRETHGLLSRRTSRGGHAKGASMMRAHVSPKKVAPSSAKTPKARPASPPNLREGYFASETGSPFRAFSGQVRDELDELKGSYVPGSAEEKRPNPYFKESRSLASSGSNETIIGFGRTEEKGTSTTPEDTETTKLPPFRISGLRGFLADHPELRGDDLLTEAPMDDWSQAAPASGGVTLPRLRLRDIKRPFSPLNVDPGSYGPLPSGRKNPLGKRRF